MFRSKIRFLRRKGFSQWIAFEICGLTFFYGGLWFTTSTTCTRLRARTNLVYVLRLSQVNVFYFNLTHGIEFLILAITARWIVQCFSRSTVKLPNISKNPCAVQWAYMVGSSTVFQRWEGAGGLRATNGFIPFGALFRFCSIISTADILRSTGMFYVSCSLDSLSCV